MSEQTPNSSEDLSGAEPSMEDILASIRKIISEDEPVALESPEDITPNTLDIAPVTEVPAFDLTSDAVLDEIDFTASQAAEGESVDLNIDDVLAGLEGDLIEPDLPTSEFPDMKAVEAPMQVETSLADDDIFSELDGDILSLLGDDVPSFEETSRNVAPIPTSPVVMAAAAPRSDSDDEMNALLDDILMSPDEDEAVSLEDFDLDAVEAAPQTPVAPVRVESGEDLDLVKSLMADLADDPDDFVGDEDLDALLAIPEVEETPVEVIVQEAAPVAAVEPESPEPEAEAVQAPVPETLSDPAAVEEDILGDILNMTLEDELSAQPDSVFTAEEIAQMESVNVDGNDTTIDDDVLEGLADIEDTAMVEVAEDDVPSLTDIAAAAEADAVAAEQPSINPLVALGGMSAGIAALSAKSTVVVVDDPAPASPELAPTETPIETYVQVAPEPQPEPVVEAAPEPIAQAPATPAQTIPSLETDMPVQAVNTDTILDDVTESATAGAFAQLNQVVEDKAIFSERGPRIGDLVQEALRPMLKEWLDANLKGIVERAVTKEVKRISSGK